jgi:hypothetical protein
MKIILKQDTFLDYAILIFSYHFSLLILVAKSAELASYCKVVSVNKVGREEKVIRCKGNTIALKRPPYGIYWS